MRIMRRSWRALLAGVLLVVGVRSHAAAQIVRVPADLAAMGRPELVRSSHVDAQNPAAFVAGHGPSFRLHVGRPYKGSGLNSFHAGMSTSIRGTAVGVVAGRFGYEDFAQTHVALAAASSRTASSRMRVAAGVRSTYVNAAPKGYPAENAFGLDVGWLVVVDSAIVIGAAVQNVVVRGVHAPARQPVLGVGAAYRTEGGFIAALSVTRERGFPASTSVGVQLPLGSHVMLRAGSTLDPVQLCGGIGLKIGRLNVDMAAVSHAYLGLSTALTLTVLPGSGR